MNVFLVFMPEGQLFECTHDQWRAKQAARNIGGTVAIVPMLYDYRNGEQIEFQYPDFALDAGLLKRMPK